MRRFYAVMLGLAMLAVTPGLATAQPYPRPAANQQYIDYVIQRALSQRGVPFTYGGGDATGPTRGTDRNPEVAAAAPGALGTVPGAGIFGTNPATGITTLPPGAAPPLFDPRANVVGFDASGLMVYAFAGVGIKLPRSSGEQYLVGRKVTGAQALPGDLIFYGPNGTQSVALFLGNGQMLETGDNGVTVSPVRLEGMAPYLSRIIE